MENPKLSICVITYNHERFIRQALDSVLKQQCSFEYEIIIGLDKSPDTTGEVVQEYIQKYPQKTKLITSGNNVGMIENWIRSLSACRGEYVAILEADDFWMDTLKLQKQVEFLDRNLHYALSFHDVDILYDGTPETEPLSRITGREGFTIEDLIVNGWFVPTCSVVYRRSYLKSFPEWIRRKKAIDISVELLLATQGDLGYIPEKMSTYRLHPSGISQVQWSGKERIFEFSMIPIFTAFDKYSNYKYHHLIKKRVERDYLKLLKKNEFLSRYYLKALRGYICFDYKNIVFLRKILADGYYSSNIYAHLKK